MQIIEQADNSVNYWPRTSTHTFSTFLFPQFILLLPSFFPPSHTHSLSFYHAYYQLFPIGRNPGIYYLSKTKPSKTILPEDMILWREKTKVSRLFSSLLPFCCSLLSEWCNGVRFWEALPTIKGLVKSWRNHCSWVFRSGSSLGLKEKEEKRFLKF